MYEINKLPNGLRIIRERIPFARSVSVGLWFGTGSMHETPDENGLSHFLEHMLFKGTTRRNARAIAETMDAIGGQINAFTSKDCTCFYAKVMDEHLSIAIDLLADLAMNAVIDPVELDKERSVILEEIAMTEDSPEDLVHEMLAETIFKGSPLAQPILGPAEKVSAYTREDLHAYRTIHYRPRNAVLSIAGHYEQGELDALIDKHFAAWQGGKSFDTTDCAHRFNPSALQRSKDIEQVHVCLAFPGLPMGDPDVYAMSVFNNMLGGGMSSRLFQRIREELGMAYSVYSFATVHPGCGYYSIYAGTSAQHLETVLSQFRKETARLLSDGVDDAEFTMAREQLKGSYILSMEGTSSRMTYIGRSLLLLGRVYDEEEVLRRIGASTKEDVMRVAGDILLKPHGAAIVGRDVSTLPASLLLD